MQVEISDLHPEEMSKKVVELPRCVEVLRDGRRVAAHRIEDQREERPRDVTQVSGQENDPSAEPFPAVYPDVRTLMNERPLMARSLRVFGVTGVDLADMVQVVTLAAWQAIHNGRDRPDPACSSIAALRAWVVGISWRQASHYRERASYRREVPFAKPSGVLHAQSGAGSFEQLVARDALRAIALLPERYIAILSAVARGQTIAEYARENGMKEESAWSRLRLARIALATYLAGREWRRR